MTFAPMDAARSLPLPPTVPALAKGLEVGRTGGRGPPEGASSVRHRRCLLCLGLVLTPGVSLCHHQEPFSSPSKGLHMYV